MTSLRDVLLAEIDLWSFPVTNWELATVKEIDRLPAITVHRVDAAKLESMRMKPRECHANARWLEANDPEAGTKRIIGWWPHGGRHVLHSIVNHRGQYLCFTPVDERMFPETRFEFVPDQKIEVREENGYSSYFRDGQRIGRGVRFDPVQALADLEIARQRLLSGMDPYEAVKLP
jgi:hypothetical protein